MRASELAERSTLPPAWAAVLPGWTAVRLRAVQDAVVAVSADAAIAPDDPLRALRLVGPEAVKVVILGQDPYPTAGHADGLAFSAGKGRPRSLARIFELLVGARPGFVAPKAWSLDGWARQGVLLLNPVLTVEIGRSGSHLNCGWQALTRQIISHLCGRDPPPVFLLWGKMARDFWTSARPEGCRATVLTTRHPSYDFDRAFMAEGDHFSATAHLIDWWSTLGVPEGDVL